MTTNKILTPSEQALEKRRVYQRKYYKRHKVQCRKYSEAHREKIRARAAEWRKKNRKRYLAQQAMYDLHNRGRMYPEDRMIRLYKWLYESRSDPEEG